MRVNFRGENITLKNENVGDRKHFTCHWEGFTIDVEKVDGVWESYVKDFTGCICNTYHEKSTSLTDAVQWCFDEIDSYLNKLEKETLRQAQMLKLSRKYRKEVICPLCGSKKIFKFRLDSDWASGSGDYTIVNSDENYTDEELNYDSFDRPDIEIHHCGECNYMFG